MHEHEHLTDEFGFHVKEQAQNLLYYICNWLEVFALSYLECNIWSSDLLALIILCGKITEAEASQPPPSDLGNYSYFFFF